MAGGDEDKKDATPEEEAAKEEAAKAPEEVEKKDEAPAPTPTVAVSAETLNNVAERLKFFFSDANVRGDRFMQNQINIRQANGKRPVPIEVLLRFNTLKKYTTDANVVIQAAKELLADQLVVVVNTDNGKPPALQRVHSFTTEMMNDNVPKTLVVSNLPIQKKTNKKENDEEKNKEEDEDDEATYAVSMDDIRKVFEEFGPVAMIRMRFGPSPKQQEQQQQEHSKHEEKQRVQYRYPAQYAFVEYEALTDCEKAAAEILTCKQGNDLEPKRKLQLGGNDLKVISLQDYMDEQKMKRQAKKDGDKTAPEEKEQQQRADGGGSSSSSTEKKKNTENNKSKDNNDKTESSYTVDWKPGCVIKLEGLADGCDREAIMTAVAKAMDYSTVEALKAEQLVYVDYSRGQATGAVRFFEPNDKIKTLLSKLCPTTTTTTTTADSAEDNAEGGGGDEADKAADADGDVIQIAGAKVEKAYLLEGEQEEKYWKEFIDFKNHQKRRQAESDNHHRHDKHNNNKRGGGGGGKHQHHRNSKRQKRR